MKKIYSLALGLMILGTSGAQTDTLIWEDFNGETWTQGPNENELITQVGNTIVYEFSPGIVGDDKWYNIDMDGWEDANGRPAEWFRAYALADADSAIFDGVYASSSWFTPFNIANNWLITKSFYCTSDAVLSWYSAPRQTPRFLDGYKVKVSTTNNDPGAFNTIIFTAKEFDGLTGADTCDFADYQFKPAGPGFVHGLDGTYVTDNGQTPDCSRQWGLLKQHTVSLSQFAGQRIYIAFHHDSDDDNLITIDNILVTGTLVDDASIKESGAFTFSAYPNPAVDVLNLGYQINGTSDVLIRVTDNSGRIIRTMDLRSRSGNDGVSLDVSDLAAGVYIISVETDNGKAVKKFVKK